MKEDAGKCSTPLKLARKKIKRSPRRRIDERTLETRRHE
jgi:hypothetical protein